MLAVANGNDEQTHTLAPRDDAMMSIIRSEFTEMPDMRLSRAQFRRLWHLTAAASEHLVRELIAAGFLVEDVHGRLSRAQRAH
jgi:hypothetical protein